jgi:hypothetical protein
MPYRGWQKTRLPLVRGMREDIDPRVLPEGTFKSISNMRFDKTGKLRAAPTFTWSGSTGFDDRFASTEPALGSPQRIYSLRDQQLVSDGFLRSTESKGSTFKYVGPMPNVQMDPLLDIIAVAEATNIVEHDIAYSNGYLVVAW